MSSNERRSHHFSSRALVQAEMRWRYSLSVIMIPCWLAASRHSAMQSGSRPSSNEYASSSGA